MRYDDPKADNIRALRRAPRQLGAASPLQNSSVDTGGLYILSEEGLIVEGSERITGTWYLDGVGFVSGTLTIIGNEVISGTLTIGTMVLDTGGPYGGRIVASGPLQLASSQVVMTGNATVAGGATVALNFGVGTDTTLQGTLTNSGHPTTSSAANAVLSAGGLLQRSTSASRFKIDPQLMDLPDSLLDVPVEWWIDFGEASRLSNLLDRPRPWTAAESALYDDISLRRVPGFIAEKVEAAGGGAFVNYTADGEVEGIMYDRYIGARTAVLGRRADEQQAEIDELKKIVRKLLETA